ncbi:FAD-dependent oxidoreductase [Gammaproteobacteria bacterium]|nr:FAD-dependent oxidoreductase [Gammaproteobacteria bacterium]
MKVDFIIVGAGIIGMTMALALCRSGKKVAIIEKNLEKSLKINRVYTLSEKTKLFYQEIGLWDDILEINNLDGMSIYYRNLEKNNIISFSRNNNNNIGYIVQSKNIILELKETLSKYKNFSLMDKSTVNSMEEFENSVKIKTDKNIEIEGEYLISCEGSNSQIKKDINIKNTYDDYKSIALVFNIEHKIANNNIAFQIFLESGPIAFLPIDNNNFSMVVSVKNKFASDKNFSKENICNYLEIISSGKFGKIQVKGEIASFNLMGFDSEKYKLNNILFVGDSAHGIHPLAGMGLNLGVSDIIEIMKTIDSKSKISGSKNFFSAYARRQKIINKNARQQLKFIERIYSIENSVVKNIIKITMQNIQKSNYIKSAIVKHANNNLNFF